MTDMNVQKANENSFLVKILLSKTYFSNFTKVSGRFELRLCGSQDQGPRPLSYDDTQESRPI